MLLNKRIKIKKLMYKAQLRQRLKDEKEFKVRWEKEVKHIQYQHSNQIQLEIKKVSRDYEDRIARLNRRLEKLEAEKRNFRKDLETVITFKTDLLRSRDKLVPLVKQLMGMCGLISSSLDKIELVDSQFKIKKIGEK